MKKLFAFVMALLFVIPAFATDYFLENISTTDTYIRSSVPNSSFDITDIETGGWGDTYIGLVKFNVSSLPSVPAGGKVSVWFYNRSPGGAAVPVNVQMGLLATDFNSATTWNNAVLSWYTSTIRTVNVSPYGFWTEFEITDYYNYWKMGVANYGFALVPVGTNNEFNLFPSSATSTVLNQKPLLRITAAGDNHFMDFPVSGTLFPQGAYTAGKMISVLDHNMTALYQRDGNITSFTGEQFAATVAYPATVWAPCYPKVGGASWSSLLQNLYVGTSGSGYSNCTVGVAINYDSHPGYDFAVSGGTEVRTGGAGTVVSQNGGCIPKGISEGCAIWGAVGVDHGNGYVSQYLHLATINVSPGQVIPAGHLLGTSGNKSPASKPVGYHLHFEVLKLRPGYSNDYQVGSYATVDPYGYNAASGVQDVLANTSGVGSVCLWRFGCTLP